MQAILRGAARRGAEGDCRPMTAVIPMVQQTGLSDDELHAMFPEANIIEDRTLMPAKPLRGRLKKLADSVTARLAAGDTEITYTSLAEAVGISRKNVGALVKKDDWKEWLDAMRLQVARLKGGAIAVRVSG